MKKKSLQKTLALALAAVMSLGTLAGCANSGTTAESTSGTEAAAESTASTAAEAESDAATEAASTEAAGAEGGGMDSWEPFAENVTLQVPVYDRGLDGVPDVSNNYWTQWVQENFGDPWNITVEYVPITRNDAMTDYALLASAGTLPTMLMEFDYPKLAQWSNDGYLTSFDMDEFAAVAPTYYNRMAELNQLQYSVMEDETYFVFAERPYSNANYSYQVFVRMDWLEQVGYDHVPSTREEYLDAMQKIMDAGICTHPDGAWMLTGNAGADQNDAFRTYPLDEREWAMYGDYNIVSMSWSANKELLRAKNEEYSLGITNPEYYVTDTETAKASFINGNSYWYGGYISGNMDFLTSFYEQNPDGKLAIQPADYLYGTSSAYRAENPFGIIVGFSSTATQDQIRAAWM